MICYNTFHLKGVEFMKSMEMLDDIAAYDISVLQTGYSDFRDLNSAMHLPADEELSELTQTSIEDLEQYDNWYFIDGDCWYYKEVYRAFVLINELLGEKLSLYMDLPTIRYSLVSKEGKLSGLISKNFKNQSENYAKGISIPPELIGYLQKCLIDRNKSISEHTRRQLTSYLIRNFYSALCDRIANTLYAYNSKEPFIMAPLWDYESSFCDSELRDYVDPLIYFPFSYHNCELLANNNDYFKYYLHKIWTFDIKRALQEIAFEHKIVIPSEFYKYYRQFDIERKEVLNEMGLKKELSR